MVSSRPGTLSRVLSLAVLGLTAVAQGKLEHSENSPAAWISEAGLHYKVAGRPLSFHDNEINLQRVTLGVARRDKSAHIFTVPEIGQYLVRVANPVRKNLAKDLRSLAVGSVRYLPHDTFVAVLSGSALASVMALDGVEDLFLRPAESKIAPELFPEHSHLNLQRRRSDPKIVTVVAQFVEVPQHSEWHQVVRSVITEWRTSLRGLAGPKLDIDPGGGRFVSVATDVTHMEAVVAALSQHPLVSGVMGENVLVEPQASLAGEAIMSGPGYSEHKMWDKGLLGAGEIVSISDSGLDYDMGWFADSGQAVEKCTADVQSKWDFTGDANGCTNMNHRKIVSYRGTKADTFPGDFYDKTAGHGTHVAGILAGSRQDGVHTAEGTGICPLCKLVIDDMDSDGTYTLYAGPDISKVIQHSYNVGARLHSCSLGKPQGNNWYGAFSQQWDGWLVANDDALILSAAGNYGFGEVEFSIVDPAPAKNTVTVGATQNGRQSGRYNEGAPDSYGEAGANRDLTGTPDTRKDFVSFEMTEWDRFRVQTSEVNQPALAAMSPAQGTWARDPYDMDLTDASLNFDNYFRSPQIEVREVAWGRTLGSNEVVEGQLLGLDQCMCKSATDDFYPYTFPAEPWTLIVVWDWGYDSSKCRANLPCLEITEAGGDPMEVAWANIMGVYNAGVGMQGLIIVEPDCVATCPPITGAGTTGATGTWDADQWWTMPAPAGVSAGAPAPFAIGQVAREGSAVWAYTSGDYFLYHEQREYYYMNYGPQQDYAGDAPGMAKYSEVYVEGGTQTALDALAFAKSMTAVWPHDRRARIAGLSSRGPTLDLRFIPDIMCPGEPLKSAKSDGTITGNNLFDLTLKSGTSMATPVCAGGAALIREYLREGWYGDGTKNSAGGQAAPSGALIKAMMVQSAQPVYLLDAGASGTVVNYYKVKTYPNFHTGFGRLSLDHVLMFNDSPFTLKFADRVAVDQGEIVDFCVQVSDSSQPLVVTLTWTDPAAVENTIRTLVNDLDLVVVSATGEFWYGNGIMWTDEVNTAGRPVRDSRNNVEKVTIAVPAIGKYSIRVIGMDVPDGPQNFAYVVTGAYADAEAQCGNLVFCENACSGHGTCNCANGNSVRAGCQCDPTHSGTDCSFENVALTASDYQIELGAASTAYYTIDASTCSDITVTYTVTQGDAYVLIAEGVLPVDYGSASSVTTGINSRLYYAEYGQLPTTAGLPTGPSGEQVFTTSTAVTGTWVMSVTSVVDPKAGDESPTATVTKLTARVQLTPTTGCAAPATLPACAGAQPPDPTPGPTLAPGATLPPPATPAPGGGSENCPTQDSTYAACALFTAAWPDITQLEVDTPADVLTGGLGGKMVDDVCEVYVCVPAARVTGCTPPGWFCFFYDEVAMVFKPWGTQADLGIESSAA